MADGSTINVGDNLPYSGLDLAYTLNLHGTATGIANCAIEINQNQIQDKSGIKHWAKTLTSILQKIIKIEELYKIVLPKMKKNAMATGEFEHVKSA